MDLMLHKNIELRNGKTWLCFFITCTYNLLPWGTMPIFRHQIQEQRGYTFAAQPTFTHLIIMPHETIPFSEKKNKLFCHVILLFPSVSKRRNTATTLTFVLFHLHVFPKTNFMSKDSKAAIQYWETSPIIIICFFFFQKLADNAKVSSKSNI